jgi:hypothetical protein
MHLDWGASQFLTKQVQIGLVGHLYDEVSCDSGSGDHVGCFESLVAGIDPQIGYLFPDRWDAGLSPFQGVSGLRRGRSAFTLECAGYVLDLASRNHSDHTAVANVHEIASDAEKYRSRGPLWVMSCLANTAVGAAVGPHIANTMVEKISAAEMGHEKTYTNAHYGFSRSMETFQPLRHIRSRACDAAFAKFAIGFCNKVQCKEAICFVCRDAFMREW